MEDAMAMAATGTMFFLAAGRVGGRVLGSGERV